ncbi:MAG: hypothetical protein ACLQBA_21510 [Candidatus Binataceae bacterium]
MTQGSNSRLALASGIIAAAILIAPRAFAIDFYEIQIYDTETTPQNALELELHSNTVTTASGPEAQAQIRPYEIHETLEATYGLTPHIEIGQYLCTAKLDNGDYEYSGSRTKMHFGIAATDSWPVSLGGNIELDYMRHAAEENPLTLELRPILETHYRKFTLVADFAFEKPFSGPGTHKGMTLAPSGEVTYDLIKWLTPAVEYYGDMGAALEELPGIKDQQHFIVPTLNFNLLPQLELNMGVGFGLTRASNGTFIKSIIGWEF